MKVINGLMSREDWETAISFPIGCIPGGSGNALCLNINYLAGYVHFHVIENRKSDLADHHYIDHIAFQMNRNWNNGRYKLEILFLHN